MKISLRYLLLAGFATLSLTNCDRNGAQQTPAISQQKGSVDEGAALKEADLLLAAAAKQTGVTLASLKNARTALVSRRTIMCFSPVRWPSTSPPPAYGYVAGLQRYRPNRRGGLVYHHRSG